MASSKRRIKFHADGFDGFSARSVARARALDRNEPLPAEHIVTFRNPADMFQVLTPKRFALLQHLANTGPQPVHALAESLQRNGVAIARDLKALAAIGVLRTSPAAEAGQPSMTIVSPIAGRLEIMSVIAPSPATTHRRSKAS